MIMKLIISLFLLFAQSAYALSIDWHGYFRADSNIVHNYQMDLERPGNFASDTLGGEFISGEGSKSAEYISFFARLRPVVLINDNIILNAELDLGSPTNGFLGTDIPADDANNSFSFRRSNLDIGVSRLWLDTFTDFGTLQVGRAPLHWGLGVIFDSGDDPFDRYQSTTDVVRLVSKFGKLTLSPSIAKASVGRSLGGGRNNTASTTASASNVDNGSDDVTDVSVSLVYDDTDRDLEVGAMIYKRAGLQTQTGFIFPAGATTADSSFRNGISAKMINAYLKKKWYRLSVGVEVPYYFGNIGDYNNSGNFTETNSSGSNTEISAIGFASEIKLDMPSWKHKVMLGHAPGQGPTRALSTTGGRDNQFTAMFFNRNYNIANIMFNYNLRGFGATNPDDYTTPNSPYDSAVVNAKYISLQTGTEGEQWAWYVRGIYAQANETAVAGKDVYVHSRRRYEFANQSQEKSLGMEVDLGGSYQWDESIRFGLDLGIWFPGDFYKFSNGTSNSLDPVVVQNISKKADRVVAGSLTLSTVF